MKVFALNIFIFFPLSTTFIIISWQLQNLFRSSKAIIDGLPFERITFCELYKLVEMVFNLHQANVLFLDNPWFSDVFRGYTNGTLT